MPHDALATSFLNQLTPELLAAGLLVLASLCFFAGALVLLLVMQPRLKLQPTTAATLAAASTIPIEGAPVPVRAQESRGTTRNRLSRRRSALAIAPEVADEGRDFSREILLAQQGSDAEQLMKDCGLSQLEANLVVKLYGHGGESPSMALG